MDTFTAGSCIRFGWETFKKRAWFFIGMTLAYLAISWIIGFFGGFVAGIFGEQSGNVLSSIIIYPLNMLLGMGFVALTLKAHDDPNAARFGDLWHPRQFWTYLAASIMTTVVTVCGFILLIIPGIILSILFYFVTYLIIDRELGPIEAMRESIRITKGHRWTLFLLLLASLLICLVGVVCLFVGILVAFPIVALSTVHAYRRLSAPGDAAPAL